MRLPSDALSGLLFANFLSTGFPDVTPDPPRNGDKTENSDHEVKAMEPGLQRVVLVPLFAKLLSDVSQSQAPGKRAGKGVDDETSKVHSRDARGKGNEGSYDRQQPARKNYQLAPACEPSVGEVEIVM